MISFDYSQQPKRAVVHCDLCKGLRFEPYAKWDRYGLPVKSSQCLICGLVFLNPLMTAGAYQLFYAEGHYRSLLRDYYGEDRFDPESLEKEQRDYARRLTSFVGDDLHRSKAATLLDLGGSTGVVADSLARGFGLRATVVDPAREELGRATARGLETVLGTAEAWQSRPGRYDVVLLCRSVDHLRSVSAVLRKIRSALSPEGLFFVDAVDYRRSAEKGREEAIKLDHPYYLEPALMRQYLDQANFEVIRTGHDEDGLHVRWLCAR